MKYRRYPEVSTSTNSWREREREKRERERERYIYIYIHVTPWRFSGVSDATLSKSGVVSASVPCRGLNLPTSRWQPEVLEDLFQLTHLVDFTDIVGDLKRFIVIYQRKFAS